MNETIRRLRQLPPPAILSILAIVAGLTLAAGRHAQAGESEGKKAAIHIARDDTPIQRDGKSIASFAPMVKKVEPSVVTITTSTQPRRSQSRSMLPDDPFLRRFFGEQFGGDDNRRPQKQIGLGSGVIVTKDGYILTNNHVVDGADSIEARLNDGREFTAKVIGADQKSDIAVLKIKADDLPFVTMADSDKIETGDVVLAIGNPFGIGQTVTMGIVSATGRTRLVGNNDSYEDFIQTDAAINPGNSGGALVDIEGRLIGVNAMIYSRSGGYQGVSLAVPSNLARRVMESLVRDGRVVRGYLGIWLQDVTPDLAQQFKLSDGHGALVADVIEKSPAEKAGFKSGDVITRFDGKPVSDSSRLRLDVSEIAPGTTVPVEVIRDGEPKKLEVTLREIPGEKAKASEPEESTKNDTLNGVAVADLDSATRSQLQIPAEVHGVLVKDVAQESPAYEKGLRPGDVIIEINHKAVRSADQAVEMTTNVKDPRTLLKIWQRNPESGRGGIRYMVVDESKGN